MTLIIGAATPRTSEQRRKVAVIIQARMTSARFPGKSMAVLRGKPVLQWVIERCQEMKTTDHIIVAVPDAPESEPMLQLIKKLDVDNFCGSELNVLERYYYAAKFFNLDVIVRVTADCPFIQPKICDEIVQLLIWRKCDYVCNFFPKATYQKGLECEAFTFDALEAAHQNPRDDCDKEHVTPWMRDTVGLRRACIHQKINKSHINWCVDTKEDLARLELYLERQNAKVN